MQPVIQNSNAVYFVENAEEFDLPSIAIRPTPFNGGLKCDGNPRGFKMWGKFDVDGNDGANNPRKIIVHSEYGGDIILVKLTNDIYEKHLREYVIGQPKFNTDGELQDFYLKNDFNPNS
jgi:hypothetical protein